MTKAGVPLTYGMMTYNGVTLCKKDWAERLGISITGLIKRLKRMSVEEALSLGGRRR